MTLYLFDAPQTASIPVQGETASYPIHRIFCVGRNYAAHAVEMGAEVDREAPFYFTKSAQAAVPSGASISYPSGTENYHHEMELAVLLQAPLFKANETEARAAIYGYCCALDMTRRDLQSQFKDKRRPWDLAKDFEASAVFAPASPASEFGEISEQRIHLSVNGEIRQDATLSELIHSVPAVLSHLSGFYHLVPGDVILTGTPAGVGPVVPGDEITGGIDGLAPIALSISAPE